MPLAVAMATRSERRIEITMNSKKYLEVLKKVDFLKPLPETDLVRLIQDCREVQLKPDEVLFNDQEPGNTMYVILTGEVFVYKEHKVISLRGPGDFLGELSLMESAPRSATIRSVEGTTLIEITREDFKHYFVPNADILMSFLKTITRRFISDLRELDEAYYKLAVRNRELAEIKQSQTTVPNSA